MSDVIRINPSLLRYKISQNLDVRGVVDGDWDISSRVLIEETAKYRSIRAHFVDGVPWEQTGLFTKQYAQRIAAGDSVRGATTMGELVKQYETRVDGLYASLKKNGFRDRVDGEFTPIPKGFIARDGEVLMSNAGNHRIAMAKILGLPFVLVRILARHAQLKSFDFQTVNTMDLPKIPAMTTEKERREYYDLTLKASEKGAVIELGAWLGAATVWLAAALRDANAGHRVQVYDRFQWDATEHERKAPGAGEGGLLEAFTRNLGDLRPYVDVHQGDIRKLKWTGGPIGMIVFDAPKRIPAISHTLTEFAGDVKPGTLMAWQDFAHFPSYEIVACLSRLEAAGNIKFLRAVYPGTTAVFKVVKPWTREQVTESALAIKNWKVDEIATVWQAWADRLPEPMQACFLCGAPLFMCDIGRNDDALYYLRLTAQFYREAIMPKFCELKDHRPDLVQRYAPLFGELFG